MTEVSTFRMYLLRVGYLIVGAGLVVMIWPGIVSHGDEVPHMNTAVRSLLGGVSILAFVGIRHPLKMLPVMLFELIWKTIWVVSFGLPLWSKQRLIGDFAESMVACVTGIILVLIVVPWGYVYRHYVKAPSESWLTEVK